MVPFIARCLLVALLLIGQSVCCCAMRWTAPEASIRDASSGAKPCCCHHRSHDDESEDATHEQQESCKCRKAEYVPVRMIDSTESDLAACFDQTLHCLKLDSILRLAKLNLEAPPHGVGFQRGFSFCCHDARSLLCAKASWVC
jgi:hypothetical protein